MTQKLDAMGIYNTVNGGRGKLLGEVGVQNRPVYEIDGFIYEKAINFDDGQDHSYFYKVSEKRADELRKLLSK